MPRDIRSYFTSSSSVKTTKKPAASTAASIKPKKKRAIISSDEEERNSDSPAKRQKLTKKTSVIHTVSDSDDDLALNNTKKNTKKTEKLVSPSEIFGSAPIKRVDGPKITKNTQKLEAEFHDDNDFEATLNQIDLSQIEEDYQASASKTKSRTKDKDDSGKKSKKEAQAEKSPVSPKKHKEEKPTKLKHSKSPSEKSATIEDVKKVSPKSKKAGAKNFNTSIEIDVTKVKSKEKKESVDPFEERIEKKKQSAALYQQYLNRGGARNPGSKPIPEGAENCLAGLSFLITGVLDSLEREEADDLVKKYGGRILHTVSRKTNYIVIGDQPGPAKITKAESFGVKKLTEDDLLDLIRTRPAGKASDIKVSQSKPRQRKKSEDETERLTPAKKKHSSTSDYEVSSPSPLKQIKKEHVSPTTENGTKHASPVKQSDRFEHSVKIKKETARISEDSNIETKASFSEDSVHKGGKAHSTVTVYEPVEALVEKYRPKTMKQIVGQHGDKSNARKLFTWLSNWYKHHNGKVKITKPSIYNKNDDGGFFKAALLSGPPGIGKTTTVQVVCKELGFDLVEFNASDTRSKKLLKEEVTELLSCKSVKGFFSGNQKDTLTQKHVLLMDEVDGMAGNEDRGGLQELIVLIKSTDVPIICICNDRNNPKMRTLANYTFDLRFQKPKLEQIRGCMKSICCKEKIDISNEDLDNLILATNQDIRQVINHLALLQANPSCHKSTETNRSSKPTNKDLKLGPWDVARKVFSAEEHKKMNIHDKSDLFFHDYSIAPLFVQETYLSVVPNCPKNQIMEKIAEAADSIAFGDVVDKCIRSNNSWSLLPVQACFASVIPGSVLSGHITSQINFPSWLGRNSKQNKFNRLLQELTIHARMTTGASKEAINLDYLLHLRDNITRPLIEKSGDGVDEALNILNSYHLVREDVDSLVEVSLWPGQRDPLQCIDSKVKAAFTRACNKSAVVAPYALSGTASKKKPSQASQDEGFEEDGIVESDEDDDNVDNDKMIKAKKMSNNKATTQGSKSKNDDSKPQRKGKGQGKKEKKSKKA